VRQLIAQVEIRADEIVAFTRGRRRDPLGDTIFTRVCTDSRSVEKGDVFVALRGARFDGHRFVKDALEKGAAGVVVDRDVPEHLTVRFSPVVIEVEDTLRALGDMAAGWRKKFSAPVGVLTGSNGKTTTKEMTARILERSFRLLSTQGNFNNLIGVPLTLLELGPCHERVLIEMGMNRHGEIKRLTSIAQPQYGALLNIGPAHLERFEDLRDIARAKAEMLEAMSRDAVLVFNRDDPLVCEIAAGWKGRSLSYGCGGAAGADVSLLSAEDLAEGQRLVLRWEAVEIDCMLHVFGEHNRSNAVAAAAMAVAMGADAESVKKGLEAFAGVPGRCSLVRVQGLTVIDDTYNANPRSMQCALETLTRMSGSAERYAVLGDMLELGSFGPEAHRALGALSAAAGLSAMVLIGGYAETVRQGAIEAGMDPERIVVTSDPLEAAEALLGRVAAGAWVLVKGSRGMAMERVVRSIQERMQGRAVA
jgi:UDP-N-acetylmuramoyl-tripeptide--D-alanyl-D-alanine ligase